MRDGTASRTARGFASTVAALVLALGAVACSDDDDSTTDVAPVTAGGSTTSEATPPADDSTTTGPTMGSDDSTTSAPSTTAVGGLAAGRCERLAETSDGVYPVSDAGEVELVVEGGAVRLAEARPAAGWTATDDLEDDDEEVEVDFRRDGREVEFEAELDDGRLEVEVCED